MRVKSTIHHHDEAGNLHPPGDEYELPEGDRLTLHLKDYIVVQVENPPAVPPSVFKPMNEA